MKSVVGVRLIQRALDLEDAFMYTGSFKLLVTYE